MKILQQTCIALFLSFAFNGTNATHSSDDDILNTSNDFDTDSPTDSPTLVYPAPSKTPIPSPSKSSAQPSAIPTKMVTLSPSKSPTIRTIPTEEVLPTESCEFSSSGLYGSQTSDKITLQYYYQMTYNSESDPRDLIADLDSEIANVSVKNTNMFPECNTAQNFDDGGEIYRIVGISSSPSDKINSYCDGSCVVVDGRLTLYLSAEESRYLSTLDGDIQDMTKSSIKDAMSNGELNLANPNILSLTYVEPSDSSIQLEGEDEGLESNEEKSKGAPVGGDIPVYSYALLATAATVSLAVLAIAVKRRKKNDNGSSEESDHESLSPRKMEEDLSSLADDGSSSFFDRSGTSKLYLAWKDLSIL